MFSLSLSDRLYRAGYRLGLGRGREASIFDEHTDYNTFVRKMQECTVLVGVSISAGNLSVGVKHPFRARSRVMPAKSLPQWKRGAGIQSVHPSTPQRKLSFDRAGLALSFPIVV
jgi:hypothetical protein